MIIVRITGGLGNQMFQYAFARYLSCTHQTELKLDITEYERKKHRVYLLDRFNIHAEIATHRDIRQFLKFTPYLPEIVRPFVLQTFSRIFPNVLRERHFHFDEHVLHALSGVYMIGFWQSEKYFVDIEKTIRKEFTLKKALSLRSKKMLNLIEHSASVAINVRRGDYLSDPRNFKRHGVLELSYYQNAVEYIAKKIKNPVFYIFSDDPGWVKQNMRMSYKTVYMDFNYPDRSEEDLILTSKCKHIIGANSTFSWWAAWLTANKDKIVIIPQQWFRDPSLSTRDLFPGNWILV